MSGNGNIHEGLEWRVVWAPDAHCIAKVWAKTAKAAKRMVLKDHKEYRKYKGEVYVELFSEWLARFAQ